MYLDDEKPINAQLNKARLYLKTLVTMGKEIEESYNNLKSVYKEMMYNYTVTEKTLEKQKNIVWKKKADKKDDTEPLCKEFEFHLILMLTKELKHMESDSIKTINYRLDNIEKTLEELLNKTKNFNKFMNEFNMDL